MPDVDLRRQALQIATMLPEKRGDALAVIALLTQIVNGFIWPESAPVALGELEAGPNVIQLSRPTDAA